MNEVPPSGYYFLLIRLSAAKKIEAGRRGVQLFPAGYYVYIGSARRGLAARIQRHRREQKRMHWNFQKLSIYSPEKQCIKLKDKLEINRFNLLNNCNKYIDIRKSALRELTGALDLLNPTAILSRGYSITRTIPDKSIVRNADAVAQGQQLEILLNKGSLDVTVK